TNLVQRPANAGDRTSDGKEEDLRDETHREGRGRGVIRPSSVGLLQLELDVHEVVRRPRAGVLEREDLLILQARLVYALVEGLLLRAVHEERGVEDHAIA